MASGGGVGNERIAQQLLAEGRISEMDHASAARRAREGEIRIEEALLEIGAINEPNLLQYLATLHGTQFVSTKRLSRSRIDKRALRQVPVSMARHLEVYPLVLDTAESLLVVATASPDDETMLRELKLVAMVKQVRPMVARPRAIACAIARGYEGNSRPFRELVVEQPVAPIELVDPERNRVAALPDQPPRVVTPVSKTMPQSSVPPARVSAAPELSVGVEVISVPPDRESVVELPPPPKRPPLPPRPGRSAAAREKVGPSLFRGERPQESRKSDTDSSQVTSQFNLRADLRQVASMTNSHSSIGLGSVTPSVESERYANDLLWRGPHVEMLHAMSGLIDVSRDGLAGHSSAVARFARGVAERIQLPVDAVLGVVMASLLHDAGKPVSHHLTALNVAQDETHRQLAQQYVNMPRELFATAELPGVTLSAIDSMYERFEGGGLPSGLSGQGIPVEARILAVADSYADLVSNPNNVYQRLLTSEEALATLRNQAPAIFDPDVISVLQAATGGEGLLNELLEQRQAVLVVDPEPEATVMLQLKLAEYGFEAQVVRTVDAASRALGSRSFAATLCELDIEAPADGLALLKSLGDRDSQMVWLFISRRHQRQEVREAFSLGADDVVAKPVDAELLCSKVEQLVERQATGRPSSGVAGSLGQISLPDLIQVLWHSRRNCALRLGFDQEQGVIHIVEGRVVNAEWGSLRGEEAFFALVMKGDTGRFEVDPDSPPPAEQVITSDPEMLLLQAMHRLDEEREQ